MFCKTRTITEKDTRGLLRIRADGQFKPFSKIVPLIISNDESGTNVPAGGTMPISLSVGGEGDFICDRITWACSNPEDLVIQITDNATGRVMSIPGKTNLACLANEIWATANGKMGIFELSEPHRFTRNGSIGIDIRNLNTTAPRTLWISFIGVREFE